MMVILQKKFHRLKYYYEEPYAGKPHVRFCEGLTL